MPTYEYNCPKGHAFDVFQKMSDPAAATCPECGAEAERMIVPGAGFLFKGDGFYKTDSRSGGSRGANGSAAKKAGDDDATGTAKSGDADSKPSDAGSKGKASGSDGDSKGERAAASTSSS